MAFKLEGLSTKVLDDKLKKIALTISPQSGIADSLETGAWIIALQARDNALAQGLYDSGDLVDSIRPRKINQFRVDILVDVPYGAAHEFGVTVMITPKQRRFFWAMYSLTGNDMWKALALSITYTIRAKPYLRPAIDTRKAAAIRAAGRDLMNKIREATK